MMKVLYVLARYHTNMLCTVEGWLDHGDKVYMICQLKGSIEADEHITPYYTGFSKLFLIWQWLHVNVFHKNDPSARNLFIKFGIPPMRKIKRIIDDINPDLIILREKSLYTAMIYSYCKKRGHVSLLCTQSPLFSNPHDSNKKIMHGIANRFIPRKRITPSRQRGIGLEGKLRDSSAYFAPFVVKPRLSPDKKVYFLNGHINILDIGKYEERKNHILVLHVLKRLIAEFPCIRLRIIGEKDDCYAEQYYYTVQEEIRNLHLEEYVELMTNVKPREMDRYYKETDLFILASTHEQASVSVVEAMSYSIPAISGTDNGTADYIIPGVTGEVFEDCDEEDLYAKIREILVRQDGIPQMGAAAYKSVCENYVFENYYNAVMEAYNG